MNPVITLDRYLEGHGQKLNNELAKYLKISKGTSKIVAGILLCVADDIVDPKFSTINFITFVMAYVVNRYIENGKKDKHWTATLDYNSFMATLFRMLFLAWLCSSLLQGKAALLFETIYWYIAVNIYDRPQSDTKLSENIRWIIQKVIGKLSPEKSTH